MGEREPWADRGGISEVLGCLDAVRGEWLVRNEIGEAVVVRWNEDEQDWDEAPTAEADDV